MKPNQNFCLFSLFGLSLATSPVIFMLPILKILGEMSIELGKMSEELFRPDLLPLLHFSQFEREAALRERD
jgi:hypothetical protein